MPAEIEATAMRVKFATRARDLAHAVLQIERDASIRRSSLLEPGGICMIWSQSQIVRPRSMSRLGACSVL
jgi:hypothetical protein